jgi:riboflavin biosynthesis pyrimidine reductase
MSSQPALVLLSASLDLPLQELRKLEGRAVYVATGREADAGRVQEIERCGAVVLHVGEGNSADGRWLIDALANEGLKTIYSVAGPRVLEMLLRSGVLDRVYLTQVHRMLGGKVFDTLLEGEHLSQDLELKALFYDDANGSGPGQFYSVYDVSGSDG